jgi:transcriptional regulator with XRE-family HTH domain
MAIPRDPTPLQRFIAKQREKQGITQARLAHALGLAVGEHISLIEKGARTLPLSRIPLLADALGFKRVDLVKWALKEEEPLIYKILFPDSSPVDHPADASDDLEVSVANELANKILSLPPALRQSVEMLVDQASVTQLALK